MTSRVSVITIGCDSPLRMMVRRDVGVGLAAHALDRVVQGHALHRRVVELDDQVAGLDAGAEGGRVLDGRDHLDEAVLHADLDAQAAELALGADLQFLEGFGVEVGRVRVEVGEHAVDGLGDELLVLDRLDVALLDRAEHLGMNARSSSTGSGRSINPIPRPPTAGAHAGDRHRHRTTRIADFLEQGIVVAIDRKVVAAVVDDDQVAVARAASPRRHDFTSRNRPDVGACAGPNEYPLPGCATFRPWSTEAPHEFATNRKT
jgi:hypothetical protein